MRVSGVLVVVSVQELHYDSLEERFAEERYLLARSAVGQVVAAAPELQSDWSVEGLVYLFDYSVQFAEQLQMEGQSLVQDLEFFLPEALFPIYL